MLFGQLLIAVNRKKLPPEVLTETFLSPVTALESAQHRGKLRIMREYSSYLRPLQNRFVRNWESFEDFRNALATKEPNHFKGFLDALHAQCVMYGPFLAFHLSRYGTKVPKGITGSQRFTSDVRDSMQLIMSQETPFITNDADLLRKSSSLLNCRVVHSDSDLDCILASIGFLNRGWMTGDKVGAAS